jgi:hypothetical protein
MAFLDDITGAEAYNWDEAGIYQLEETDPVQGGLEGISNRPLRELAIRTRNLHNRLAEQESLDPVGDVRGAVDETLDTLEKIVEWVELELSAIETGDVDAAAILAAIRGGVATDYDTLQKIVAYINGRSYFPVYTGSETLTGTAIDFAGKPILRKTLTAATSFTATNLLENKSITLVCAAATYAATFPAYFSKLAGDWDATKTNYVQMLCVNSASGSEEVLYTITQKL